MFDMFPQIMHRNADYYARERRKIDEHWLQFIDRLALIHNWIKPIGN